MHNSCMKLGCAQSYDYVVPRKEAEAEAEAEEEEESLALVVAICNSVSAKMNFDPLHPRISVELVHARTCSIGIPNIYIQQLNIQNIQSVPHFPLIPSYSEQYLSQNLQ
ncbi:hypothetical protein PHYBLDRAFT_161456 [Phycomyces blakesleeanus NRRL 1555(-)]|uniref:Uncharacterized protein n=1 Tax=Phycomyces blakesleeanus (strain ATCC 8743b / DSM 1359 / FGSC 10004 / NBRC 33097 / NRRL 1555) TaxID=763407 RepID=A0A162V8C3_PHYB8|nr:hypothetical protein PHYBLDRAFT_161456 [Phycomyces blakesleeanus NRRL 1555(-)]OAD80813.1 hypothetical protein PHYBLDRAFT_161456 [Phycomyces blakesleeanus NRRL 1555(-)]|eukprot:XP_018298853.1 hypothetical protein PHYBLDRAFT_161456 [Phycomyces blakesleeanus NRRL 1555(-)]